MIQFQSVQTAPLQPTDIFFWFVIKLLASLFIQFDYTSLLGLATDCLYQDAIFL